MEEKIIFNNIEFLKIKEFDKYYISKCNKILNIKSNRILKSRVEKNKNRYGYVVVTLWVNKQAKPYRLHRLIAKTFIENPENKPEINHIDGNKQNNDISNLEWCTSSENNIHAIKNKLRDNYNFSHSMKGKFGKLNHSSKPILQYDLKGNFIKKWDCIEDTNRYFGHGISSSIIKVCKNKQQSSLGFIWKYYTKNYPKKLNYNLIKTCLYCNKQFIPYNSRVKYCSHKCCTYYNRYKKLR